MAPHIHILYAHTHVSPSLPGRRGVRKASAHAFRVEYSSRVASRPPTVCVRPRSATLLARLRALALARARARACVCVCVCVCIRARMLFIRSEEARICSDARRYRRLPETTQQCTPWLPRYNVGRTGAAVCSSKADETGSVQQRLTWITEVGICRVSLFTAQFVNKLPQSESRFPG